MKHLFKKNNGLVMGLLLSFLLGLMISVSSYAEDKIENFSFLDLDDVQHEWDDYKGNWIIVNYWATYCGPCLEEIPDLVSFNKRNHQRAIILGFDAGGASIEDLKGFSQDHGINYLVAPMQAETMMAFGAITAIPMSFIVSPKGKVLAKVIGVLDMDKVEKLMDYYDNMK